MRRAEIPAVVPSGAYLALTGVSFNWLGLTVAVQGSGRGLLLWRDSPSSTVQGGGVGDSEIQWGAVGYSER